MTLIAVYLYASPLIVLGIARFCGLSSRVG